MAAFGRLLDFLARNGLPGSLYIEFPGWRGTSQAGILVDPRVGSNQDQTATLTTLFLNKAARSVALRRFDLSSNCATRIVGAALRV